MLGATIELASVKVSDPLLAADTRIAIGREEPLPDPNVMLVISFYCERAFDEKDTLKARGYRWQPVTKTWYREITITGTAKEAAREELAFLRKLGSIEGKTRIIRFIEA